MLKDALNHYGQLQKQEGINFKTSTKKEKSIRCSQLKARTKLLNTDIRCFCGGCGYNIRCVSEHWQ